MSNEVECRYTPVVTVRIKKEKVFFGPGAVMILRYLKETDSFKEACEKAELSYSKGWKIINIAEEQFGHPIVVRMQGGKKGGGCVITEEGKELLNHYLEAEDKIKQYANKIFEEMFNEFVE